MEPNGFTPTQFVIFWHMYFVAHEPQSLRNTQYRLNKILEQEAHPKVGLGKTSRH